MLNVGTFLSHALRDARFFVGNCVQARVARLCTGGS